jgi:hypothetical protein
MTFLKTFVIPDLYCTKCFELFQGTLNKAEARIEYTHNLILADCKYVDTRFFLSFSKLKIYELEVLKDEPNNSTR